MTFRFAIPLIYLYTFLAIPYVVMCIIIPPDSNLVYIRIRQTEAEPVATTIQKEDSKWQQFVEGEVILKQGLVNKRKGLFARKRMLLLTTGPRLFYIDPDKMVKKGEIPMSADVRCETKNFKIFFVHTVYTYKYT